MPNKTEMEPPRVLLTAKFGAEICVFCNQREDCIHLGRRLVNTKRELVISVCQRCLDELHDALKRVY